MLRSSDKSLGKVLQIFDKSCKAGTVCGGCVLRMYGEVLNAFGHGDGCAVCKPVAASPLASLWNENILTK